MKIFYILFFTIFIFFEAQSGTNYDNDKNKEFYEGRAKFIKEYINDIKEKRKKDKKFKGSVVESLWGKIYTRLGTKSQKELDTLAINDCKKDGGIDCLVRFRSLKKNSDYNRYAKYDSSNKSVKILDEYIFVNKVKTIKNVIILEANENFISKREFSCSKNDSDYREILDFIIKEIKIYPISFLDKSGLKFILLCDKITDGGVNPVGIAPGHYDKTPGVFFVNISEINSHKENKKNVLRHVFHHEFYHIIDTTLTTILIDSQWDRINNQEYSKDLIVDSNRIDNTVKGYISKYSRNSAAEDKAELFAFMISQHKDFKKTLSNDKVLLEKSKLMISRLKSLSKDINKNFWKKLN